MNKAYIGLIIEDLKEIEESIIKLDTLSSISYNNNDYKWLNYYKDKKKMFIKDKIRILKTI